MIDIAHIHPMLIHFPLALLPVALGAQAIAYFKGQGLFDRQCLPSTGLALMVLAALGAIAAAAFGDMALDKAVDAGVPLSSLENHEELGTTSAILLPVLAILEAWFYRQHNTNRVLGMTFLGAGVVVLLVLLTTAWFGGQLVYELGINVATKPS